MTNERIDLTVPRAVIGTAVPARGGEINEMLLHVLLELVQDVRDDRDRLLKERLAGLDGAPQVDVQQASAAEREKAKEKLAELRSAKLVVEHKLKRKAEECDRAIAEVHEWRERANDYADRAREAGDDSARQEEEIRSLKQQVVEAKNELENAYSEIELLEEQVTEAREKLAATLAGAPLGAVRRHVESAIQSFDDSDKCLRALKRAQSALTAAKKTETEKDD